MTTNPSNEPNYLTFASNRPRAPLLKPAALRPEGSTVLKARSFSTIPGGRSNNATDHSTHSLSTTTSNPYTTSKRHSAKSRNSSVHSTANLDDPQTSQTLKTNTAPTSYTSHTSDPAVSPSINVDASSVTSPATESSPSSMWLKTSAGQFVKTPTIKSLTSPKHTTDSPFLRAPQSPTLPTSSSAASSNPLSTVAILDSARPITASGTNLSTLHRPNKDYGLNSSISSLQTETSGNSSSGGGPKYNNAKILPGAFARMLPRSAWTPDSQVDKCQYPECASTFAPSHKVASEAGQTLASSNFFGGFTSIIAHPFQARRHHCRACGKVFCSSHTSNSLPLYATSPTVATGNLQAPVTQPITPGAVSPVSGSFPFSLLRRASNSGTATPANHGSSPPPFCERQELSNQLTGFSELPEDSTIVQARVCDECFISIRLSSSLVGVEYQQQSQISESGSDKGALATPKTNIGSGFESSAIVHLSEPALSHHGTDGLKAAKKVSENSAQKKTESENEPNMTKGNKFKSPLSHTKAADKRKLSHPLDPRHALVASLVSGGGEDSGGSNPDGSLAASLGTTPAVGWTWSTYVLYLTARRFLHGQLI